MGSVLSGQVALVTGGGTGIGRACARALAADGAAVVLAARDVERLERAADDLRAEIPGAVVEAVGCDVTDEDAVGAACGVAGARGRFTVAVVNAGFGSANPLHLTSREEWDAVLATNLTGAFLTMKHAVPHLAGNGGGAIVAVSSIAGVETHRYMTPYTVSKAGLEMLVRQVADELGPSGIRANAVRPGLVPTDATTGLVSSPEILEDYLAQMPLRRTGSTDDVASLVRFLAGPESSWITGTCISVDGGHHLRRGPDVEPLVRLFHGEAIAPPGPSGSPADRGPRPATGSS